MQKQLHTLLQKEMSRKEFVATLGFGVASIAGLGTVLKMLGVSPTTHTSHHSTVGYGSSTYGSKAS